MIRFDYRHTKLLTFYGYDNAGGCKFLFQQSFETDILTNLSPFMSINCSMCQIFIILFLNHIFFNGDVVIQYIKIPRLIGIRITYVSFTVGIF